MLGIITIFAVLAPLIAPYAPNKLSVVNRLKPPSERWWFGTDEFGQMNKLLQRMDRFWNDSILYRL